MVSNEGANCALRLHSLAFGPHSSHHDLVALKLPILVVYDDLPRSGDLRTFLDGLERYSMGPKTLLGMLG